MKFITMRESRLQTASLRKELAADEEVILTANGKPVGLLTSIDADNLEEELSAVRRARSKVALDRIRAKARDTGADKITSSEVNRIVTQNRRERLATGKRKRK